MSCCSYCAELIENSDDFLNCLQCHTNVHIKCLRHASTPGDLLGDVFFDFTCAKCMQLQYDGPGPSSSSRAASVVAREKFSRQRLPWLMIITMALYNLSIKSKGLSHHGYFHWRTHIVSFIDKNWDYLFEPSTRRRKNWIGSVSGNLSHNNPQFFQSGNEVLNEPGWWKMTYPQKPKYVFNLYEQLTQKRLQQRNDKRLLEDSANDELSNSANDLLDVKRMRCADSDDDLVPTDSCSRTIPYMGRKPKVAPQLNIVDDDISKNFQQQPLLTTAVQSSLMDFLAENLGHDELTMFNNLPNIASEPLVGSGKNDFLPLIESQSENANFFDMTEIRGETDLNGFEIPSNERIDGKLKSFYMDAERQAQKQTAVSEVTPEYNGLQHNSVYTPSECSNDAAEDDDDEYQPRILQVTNFQQMEMPPADTDEPQSTRRPTVPNGKQIKKELKSDAEHSENDETAGITNDGLESQNSEADDDVGGESSVLGPCKESLFTKHPHRNWPWLVQKDSEELDELRAGEEPLPLQSNESLVMMSEYEEKQLFQKLRKIFSLEEKCQLQIPAYVRRFYRKLCVREWKREHSRPLFNLDDCLDTNRDSKYNSNEKTKIIDRYQLISLTSQDARKSFYARIAGSSQYELFESPYTQRILHPFIYRNTQCFPPWLKLMCEIQYASNGKIPQRSPIDFCYVRPNHIAAVNALLQTVFWPGIDMSECLSYPDYSVVALYKKLVVGCGFLVPDVGFNEAYISFMAVRPGWQRSGIATFMLYHLIQTCMSKDITLHVSATNPAVVLYQKFGFKIEEVILGFYDKYLPIDSKHSRNAFFLRLMR